MCSSTSTYTHTDAWAHCHPAPPTLPALSPPRILPTAPPSAARDEHTNPATRYTPHTYAGVWLDHFVGPVASPVVVAPCSSVDMLCCSACHSCLWVTWITYSPFCPSFLLAAEDVRVPHDRVWTTPLFTSLPLPYTFPTAPPPRPYQPLAHIPCRVLHCTCSRACDAHTPPLCHCDSPGTNISTATHLTPTPVYLPPHCHSFLPSGYAGVPYSSALCGDLPLLRLLFFAPSCRIATAHYHAI